MKITINSLCEDLSMLTSSITDVQRISNYYLNEIISLGHIPCLHLVTKILYI